MATAAPLPTIRAISPLKEMGAYEALWAKPEASFKSLAQKFRELPDRLPSDFVAEYEADYFAQVVLGMLRESGVMQFGLRVHRAGEYPHKFRDAEDPVEVLYYRGWWDLVDTPSVAVVGTREPSTQAIENATRLVKLLVGDGYTIASGLARGIDTAAHKAAIENGGKTNKEQNQIGTEKFIFVLDGNVEININNQAFILHKYNTLYFDASLPHYFRNLGKGVVKLICVGTPVSL